MSKIKLSILSLISFFIFSCTNNQINNSDQKYSVAYISGEYDGLLLKNYLTGGLKNFNIHNQDSNFEIHAKIYHNSNIFITNIDNTSNRERISTLLTIQVIDKKNKCEIFNDEIHISQFYIYASGDKFLSNQAARKKIKKDNMESAVIKFMNNIIKTDQSCDG